MSANLKRPESPVTRPTTLQPHCHDGSGLKSLSDRSALAIIAAYGGRVVDGNEVILRLRERETQPISFVARMLVGRKVVSFSWRSQIFLPTFQFGHQDSFVIPAVADVLAALGPAFDEEDNALWFSRPNSSLQGAAPMNLIAADPDAVISAARVDRFVIDG